MKIFLPFIRATALAGGLLALAGCGGVPAGALMLPPQSDQSRERQTHRYDGVKENTLLAASAGVLQDLGFNLDESESKLGVVTASRKLTSRRPMRAGEVLVTAAANSWLLFVPAVGIGLTALEAANGVKEPQLVRVSLVTRSDGVKPADGSSVRVTAQRVVYVDERQTKVKSIEPLDDALFYQEFFARLGKSVFLEEQKT
jgi:hypothetical protein